MYNIRNERGEKMDIKGVKIPYELLDAIKDDKLVIFAGAGVSMNPPAKLCDFISLTRRIAENSYITYDDKKEPDRFLGQISSTEKIPVHNLACEILKTEEDCSKLHISIVKIFGNRKIKIITTNYDELFEKALTTENIETNIYINPAIPYGFDFEGLVHIHGSINDSKSIILTDDDFGKGYMTKGQVTKFLVDVFENYHVLFIGYSYNDVIMRYLTRALYSSTKYKRYILTDSESDWKLLNIEPLYYKKATHELVSDVLDEITNIVNSSYSNWEVVSREIALNSRDNSNWEILKYQIEDEAKLNLFLKYASFEQWYMWFDSNGYFDEIFTKDIKISSNSNMVLNWMIKSYENNFNIIKQLMVKHHGQYNYEFIDRVIFEGIKHVENEKVYRETIAILYRDLKPNDHWTYQLICDLFEKNICDIAIYLLEEAIKPMFNLESEFNFSNDSNEYSIKHYFKIDEYNLNKIWKYKSKILESDNNFIFYLINILNQVHDFYVLVDKASSKTEPYYMIYASLEESKSSYNDRQILNIIAKMIIEISCNQKREISKLISTYCIDSKSSFIRKVGLIILRENIYFTPDEKITILMNSDVDFHLDKEYVFKLVAKTFDEITEEIRSEFLDIILTDISNDDLVYVYEVYNWCVWICNKCKKTDDLKLIRDELSKKYNFQPREHPELNFYVSDCDFTKEVSLYSLEDVEKMNYATLHDMIKKYNPSKFDGETRSAFLEVLVDHLRTNYDRLYELIRQIKKDVSSDNDFWRYLFNDMRPLKLSFREMVGIFTQKSASSSFV